MDKPWTNQCLWVCNFNSNDCWVSLQASLPNHLYNHGTWGDGVSAESRLFRLAGCRVQWRRSQNWGYHPKQKLNSGWSGSLAALLPPEPQNLLSQGCYFTTATIADSLSGKPSYCRSLVKCWTCSYIGSRSERICTILIEQTVAFIENTMDIIEVEIVRMTHWEKKKWSLKKAHELAKDWVKAWNAHDLNQIMFPLCKMWFWYLLSAILNAGTITGKAALRSYFKRGLRFILISTLSYSMSCNQRCALPSTKWYKNREFMEVNATGKVTKVVANYNS